MLIFLVACGASEAVLDDPDRPPAIRWDGFVVEAAETSCAVFRTYWAEYGPTGDMLPIQRHVDSDLDDYACEVCLMQLIPQVLTGGGSESWHACDVAVAAYGEDDSIDREWPPCPDYSADEAAACLTWWEQADVNALAYWDLPDECWATCEVAE